MESNATQRATAAQIRERRSEERYPSAEEAVVTILTSGTGMQGTTVDISKSGLRVRIREALEVGSRIRIKFGTTFAFGEVRWCSEVDNQQYDCGIRVEHTLAQSLVNSVHAALERVRAQQAHDSSEPGE